MPAAAATNATVTNWNPVGLSERYTALDLLRGFALFGVLLVNLLDFFRISLFAHILHFHSDPGRANHAIDLLVAELLEFKAFDLFALTFGIGIAVQFERGRRRGIGVEVFLLRRFLILLAVGALHMLLVSNVDILCLYAVCGVLVIPFLRLPATILAAAGLAAIYLPILFSMELPPESAWQAHADLATRIYREESFGAILLFRRHETQQWILPLLIGTAQTAWGLMLLGVAVWRARIIQAPQNVRPWLWRVCLIAGIIGMVNTTAWVMSKSSGHALHLPYAFQALGSNVPLAFGYAAGLVAWQRSVSFATWTAPIAAAGRMALTNYLAQSLIFSVLFNGYGFGLFGRLAPASAAAIGIAVYAVQLWVSQWWLNRYRFGPFEWLWRSLTYGRIQPMRLPSTAPVNPMATA
jgi:uncharacterized protein